MQSRYPHKATPQLIADLNSILAAANLRNIERAFRAGTLKQRSLDALSAEDAASLLGKLNAREAIELQGEEQ